MALSLNFLSLLLPPIVCVVLTMSTKCRIKRSVLRDFDKADYPRLGDNVLAPIYTATLDVFHGIAQNLAPQTWWRYRCVAVLHFNQTPNKLSGMRDFNTADYPRLGDNLLAPIYTATLDVFHGIAQNLAPQTWWRHRCVAILHFNQTPNKLSGMRDFNTADYPHSSIGDNNVGPDLNTQLLMLSWTRYCVWNLPGLPCTAAWSRSKAPQQSPATFPWIETKSIFKYHVIIFVPIQAMFAT